MYANDEEEEFSLFLDAIHENDPSLNIQCVNDGQEFVDFFVEDISKLYKLIISDLNIPKKNGLEVISDIRRYPLSFKILIIIFSDSKAQKKSL